jgi:hypothetical protein
MSGQTPGPSILEALEAGPSLADGRQLNLMLSEATVDRIDAVLMEGETRTDLLREAVDKELKRRETPKARP